MSDIGNLIKEIQKDVKDECKEDIKEQLWNWCEKPLMQLIIKGFPEFYKKHLAEKQVIKEYELTLKDNEVINEEKKEG